MGNNKCQWCHIGEEAVSSPMFLGRLILRTRLVCRRLPRDTSGVRHPGGEGIGQQGTLRWALREALDAPAPCSGAAMSL